MAASHKACRICRKDSSGFIFSIAIGQERRSQMKSTDKAVEVSAPGLLRVVERSVPEPGVGQVRIRVEACGICHTDAATVQQGNQKIQVDLA